MLGIAGLLTNYTNKHPKRSVAATYARHRWSTYFLHQTPQKVSSNHICSASLLYSLPTPQTPQGQQQPHKLGLAGLLTSYTNKHPKRSVAATYARHRWST